MTCLNPDRCSKVLPTSKHCQQCHAAQLQKPDSADIKRACADPDWRRKQSENKKALWANPEWRAKWRASRNKSKAKDHTNHSTWDSKMRACGMSLEQRRAAIEQFEGRNA